MKFKIIADDCLRAMSQMSPDIFDSCVTDPPYHLTTTKRFGGEKSAPAKSADYARLSKGFMGKAWDGGDVAFRRETWEAVFRVMKPGGWLVAFSAPRTYHRMACAVEDAGFEIRDQIMWLYGTGWPKRKTLLKPAHEPMVLAVKPGPLVLQVDAARIESPDKPAQDYTVKRVKPGATLEATGGNWRPEDGPEYSGHMAAGRYPANVVHDGSEEVMADFAQYGERGSGKMRPDTRRSESQGTVYGKMSPIAAGATYGDTGSIARYFYCAKASKAERMGSLHPTVKPLALMKWLTRLVTPPGGHVLDPFAGTGTTGHACALQGFDATMIEADQQSVADILHRMNEVGKFDLKEAA